MHEDRQERAGMTVQTPATPRNVPRILPDEAPLPDLGCARSSISRDSGTGSGYSGWVGGARGGDDDGHHLHHGGNGNGGGSAADADADADDEDDAALWW